MRALVTGDMGFVGRHLRHALEVRGWDVVGLDIKRVFEDVEAGPTPEDCRDFFAHDGLGSIRVSWFDLAVHCAAVIGGRTGIENFPITQSVNLDLDASFFRWATLAKPGRVVYISSSAVYPVQYQKYGRKEGKDLSGGPLIEADVDIDANQFGRPDEIYGWSKLTGEILAGYLRKEGVAVTVVRPFSGYGADQDLAYPFPSFIERAKTGLDPFEIWGDGEQVRDFIHIDDIIGAILTAVELEVDGPVNLCSGLPTSFNELARQVCKAAVTIPILADYNPEFQHLYAAPQGVRYRVGDPTRMLEFYRPVVTLEAGIRQALGDFFI
jgi:nucleoside-diphosphate-sugar epimerase